LQLSEAQKEVLRQSWKIIYSEIGQSLCYVGGGSADNGAEHSSDGQGSTCDAAETAGKSAEHRGVAETFFRLFEEYPQSRWRHVFTCCC
jgi:hypothetical protein